MTGPRRLQRDYRFLDPDTIDTSDLPPLQGSQAECLADSLLDLVQLAEQLGMSEQDVDEALRRVNEALAARGRSAFKLLDRPPPDGSA